MPQEKRSAIEQGAGALGVDAGGNLRQGVDTHRMRRLLILLTWLAVAVLSGCASSVIVSKSSGLADAGIAYSAAAQDILPLVRDRYLDWQSDNLLEEMRDWTHCTKEEIAGETEPSTECAQLIANLDKAQEMQQRYAQSLERLDAHARELGAYFRSLKTLAEYDSATSASNAAGRTIDRINGLSNALEGEAKKISSEQRKAWTGLVGLVGDSIKAGRLRERLRADAAAIARAIDIQEDVLSATIALLEGLDAAARREEYVRRVRTPYLTGSINDESRWRSARRASLAASPEIAQLQSLRSASARLRDVWEDILSGGGSPESAQHVFEDLSRALDALNAVHKANTSPQ